MSKINCGNWMVRACAVLLLCPITAVVLPAQTLRTLHTFSPYGSNGEGPAARLALATDGNFYGTTLNHGANGDGTVFEITPDGKLKTLHNFDGTDGFNPYGALVQASNGNFYGTAYDGGANGEGTIFQITPNGTLTTIYSFCPALGCADGFNPYAGLILGNGGDLYGTTQFGGAEGQGTVFQITLGGTLTTLHSFNNTDGSFPVAGLVQARNGDFYGATEVGGANQEGTIFQLTPSGMLTTLYSFCSQSNCTDGEQPLAALLQATDGNLYGTTYAGGTNGDGTVFQITPGGSLTTLHSFDSTDGASPIGVLIQATNGNLYGTTPAGGLGGRGTAFSITTSGTLATLFNFHCSFYRCTDWIEPKGGLIQDTNGMFYGTTESGGANEGAGTVFRLSLGQSPFVSTQAASDK